MINKFVSTLLVICLTSNSFGFRSQTFGHQDTPNITNNVNINYMKTIEPVGYKEPVKHVEPIVTPEHVEPIVISEVVTPEPPTQVVNSNKLSQEEVDLISRVVMAEAESEPLDGKLYVIDTILNRVDSKHFPNTVHEVIYQSWQFTSMWNGRYDRCSSNAELNDMINSEYENRTNRDVVFFTADKYGQYGRPSFRIANHYFSTYK